MALPVFDGGKQMATSDDGQVTILFDGYLTNRPRLRQQFQVASTAELALRCYLRDGQDFAAALEGSFVALVNDGRTRSIVLANDRFGHRPVYYHVGNNNLTFAPELKGVAAGADLAREIDWNGAADLFVFGHCWGNKTLMAGVKLLEAGSRIVWTRAETTITRYWTLNYAEERNDGEEDCVADLDAAYRAAISGHGDIEGDRLVALSGGLDSRNIACYLADAGVEFDTMSLRAEAWNSNDAVVAEKLSTLLGRDFTAGRFDLSDPETLIADFLFQTDGQAPCAYQINALPLADLRQRYGLYIHGNSGNMIFGDYATQYRDAGNKVEGQDADSLFAQYSTNFSGHLVVQAFSEAYGETIWNGAQSSFMATYSRQMNIEGARKHEWIALEERTRRSTTIALTIIASYMEPMCPLFDHYQMMDHCAAVPLAYKYDQHWYLENLRRQFPEAAAIPRAGKTIRPLFDTGPGSDLDEYTLVSPLDGFYWSIDWLLRNDYKSAYEAYLLDPRTLSRPWFNAATLKAMWDEQQAGAHYGAQLGTIMAFEYFCRTYID